MGADELAQRYSLPASAPVLASEGGLTAWAVSGWSRARPCERNAGESDQPKSAMGNDASIQVKWLAEPEDHDYPAAASFLLLIRPPAVVRSLVASLEAAPVTQFKAKDIFRASGLSLLGISNLHVQKDRARIKAGKALSPLLLVRDPAQDRVLIADGYHRLCAVYGIDEDAVVPCRIV
jgi:hypothetical protein